MSSRATLKYVIQSFLLIVLAACANPPQENQVETQPPPSIEEVTLVLGDISDDPGEVIEGTQPLADYLADRLTNFGITSGQVKIAASAEEMTRLLENGEVDIYFDSVYPATLVSDAIGATPFLRRWRFGVEEYHTVIFTSMDSGITSLEDLPGHIIAMDSPYSTSGYFLPTFTLLEAGLDMVGLETYNDPLDPDQVGFVFTYDDQNTLQWVLNGQVDAGATDDYNFNVLFPEKAEGQLVALAQTVSVPRQVAIARPGLDRDLLNAVIQILITAHETEEGQAALEAFQTSKFDEFPEGIEAALERMREMMGIVQSVPLP